MEYHRKPRRANPRWWLFDPVWRLFAGTLPRLNLLDRLLLGRHSRGFYRYHRGSLLGYWYLLLWYLCDRELHIVPLRSSWEQICPGRQSGESCFWREEVRKRGS